MSLENKVALVTGASSGIGAAIAVQFTKEGAKVVIVGRNENKLKEVSEACEKAGSKPLIIVADISKDENVKRVVNTTISHFGKLDVLVNNAGIGMSADIMAEHAIQVYDQTMATNLRSPIYLTNVAAPHLVESKGNIINISSVAGLGVMSTSSFAYCTSKAALDHFTRCAALTFASKGVRCNSVNPGPVKTDILENGGLSEAHQQAIWDNFKASTALDRISDPEEVADLVVFLASEKAKGITGATFVIDNGCLINGGLKATKSN